MKRKLALASWVVAVILSAVALLLLALQYKIDVKKYHFLYLFIEIFVMNVYVNIVP